MLTGTFTGIEVYSIADGDLQREPARVVPRAGSVAIALQAQSAVVYAPGFGFLFTAVVTLTAGTVFLMWLGEQITERGIGNGISMIILAGIVAGLPAAIAGTAQLVSSGEMSPATAIIMLIGAAVGGYFGGSASQLVPQKYLRSGIIAFGVFLTAFFFIRGA